MKTKEFVRLMEGAGFIVNDRIDDLIIKVANAFDERAVCAVSKTHEYVFDNQLSIFKNLPIETRKLMTSKLYEYSSTPLDERESIELTDAERVILESLGEGFDKLMWNDSLGVLIVTGCGGLLLSKFDMFANHFKWVARDKEYSIKDLLKG